MNSINHLIAEWRFMLIETKRYYMETIGSIFVLLLVFSIVFYGFKGISGAEANDQRLEVIVAGYILWMFALLGFQTISEDIRESMERGNLEQLYLCPNGIYTVLGFRLTFKFVQAIILLVIVFIVSMWLSGQWLYFAYGQLIIVLLIGIPGLFGLGLIFAGAILINKKLSTLLQIINFATIALIALPAKPMELENVYSYLPFASAGYFARGIMTNSLEQMAPLSWYIFIIVNSGVYLLLGIFIYKAFETKARKKNLLGQY